MKSVLYVSLIGLLASAPVECARRSKTKVKAEEKINFDWWPTQTFQETQNGITLAVRALSQEETASLFLGAGENLLKNRGWFYIMQHPLIPIYISIKNEAGFPLVFAEKNIDLGRTYFYKHVPVALMNVRETLENESWLPPALTSFNIFFKLNGHSLVHLNTLESSIFWAPQYEADIITIETQTTEDFLIFAWGKEITSNFKISIAKNKFAIDLFSPSPLSAK